MLGLALGLTLAIYGGLEDPSASACAWSPDGKWVAYVTRSVAAAELVKSGEILRQRPVGSFEPAATRRDLATNSASLWVSRPDHPRSIKILVATGPLSLPCWTKDGRSLIVVRPILKDGRVSRVETVRLQPGAKEKILLVEEVDLAVEQAVRLLSEAPACSPDGGYVVVPAFQRPGLTLLRLEDGVVVRRLDEMSQAAWSPDGFRLAMIRTSDPATLFTIEPRNGDPKRLAEIGRPGQAPVWSGDGRWIFVASNKVVTGFGLGRAEDVDLLRVSPITGQADSMLGRETERPMPGEPPAKSISFSIDKDGENLFYSTIRLGSPSSITWYRPREGFFFKRFPMIDLTIPATGLTLSPGGKYLAARVGRLDFPSAPVLYDLEKSQAIPLVPDDTARAEWITLLAGTSRLVIDGHREGRIRQSAIDPRPASPLPLPAEFADNSEEMMRLRRLAKLGRAVCRRSEEALPVSEALAGPVNEAEFFFAYLTGDFTLAKAALERMEADPRGLDDPLTLLGLRAQTALAAAEFDEFEETMRLLERIEARQSRELFVTGENYRLGSPRVDRPRWTESLRTARIRMEREDDDDGKPGRPIDPLAPRTRIDGLVPRLPVPFDPFDR